MALRQHPSGELVKSTYFALSSILPTTHSSFRQQITLLFDDSTLHSPPHVDSTLSRWSTSTAHTHVHIIADTRRRGVAFKEARLFSARIKTESTVDLTQISRPTCCLIPCECTHRCCRRRRSLPSQMEAHHRRIPSTAGGLNVLPFCLDHHRFAATVDVCSSQWCCTSSRYVQHTLHQHRSLNHLTCSLVSTHHSRHWFTILV